MQSLLCYLAIGCLEWYLALRRTLACARGERKLMASLVFLEQVVGFVVLSAFVDERNWAIVIAYALGGAIGSLLVGGKRRGDEK